MALRPSAAALLALLASGLARGEEPKSTPTRTSADASRAIRLLRLPDGRCRVEALDAQQKVRWVLRRCVAALEDLLFISNRGNRFWVLRPLPSTPPGASWESAVVARLFDSKGRLLGSRRVRDLVPKQHREEVRHLGKHFKWLEGVLGVPGKGPRVNEKNQLEFETVGTNTVRLGF